MNIFNIQHFSTGDGPGIRTTVFLSGCNLRCPWCHNPEGLYGQPFERPLDETVGDVMADIEFYEQSGGGVTISGGEPLCSFDDCLTLAKAFKDNGLNVIIDTALAVEGIDFDALCPYVDCFFVDVKTADAQKFTGVCGGRLDILLSNLEALIKRNADIVLRVPLIPNFNMDDKSTDAVIDLIKRYDKPVTLLPFHRLGSAKYKNLGIDYAYADTEPSEKDVINAIKAKFDAAGIAEANV